jgi:hypothetical protein
METIRSDEIFVISSIGNTVESRRPERGVGELVSKTVNSVSVSVLKKNMGSFLSQLKELLDNGSDKIGAFEISEIEVSAQITGDGQVALLGSGVKIEAQGGIKFTLCRVPK